MWDDAELVPAPSEEALAQHPDSAPRSRKIIFALAPIIVLAAVGGGTVYLNKAAVNPDFAAYLDRLAAASPTAATYRQHYFEKRHRQDVASGDFVLVCSTMYTAAGRDGVEPRSLDPVFGEMCSQPMGKIDTEFLDKAVYVKLRK